jgi:hypothetical protein
MVLKGRTFPKYIDRTVEGFDINNLLEVITREQELEEESTEDENKHKKVFTLRQMNTQLQARVSRYFTAEEVEAEEAIQVEITGKGKGKEVPAGLWNIL